MPRRKFMQIYYALKLIFDHDFRRLYIINLGNGFRDHSLGKFRSFEIPKLICWPCKQKKNGQKVVCSVLQRPGMSWAGMSWREVILAPSLSLFEFRLLVKSCFLLMVFAKFQNCRCGVRCFNAKFYRPMIGNFLSLIRLPPC